MSTAQTTSSSGVCLCGAVRFEVAGPLRPVVYCHCEQCRKTSGHFVAATACNSEDLKITIDRGLRWYRSSPKAQRGFCQHCGSSLFWKPDHDSYVSIMAGSLAAPTGLTSSRHIYVHMAADYYAINDELRQFNEECPSFFTDESK